MVLDACSFGGSREFDLNAVMHDGSYMCTLPRECMFTPSVVMQHLLICSSILCIKTTRYSTSGPDGDFIWKGEEVSPSKVINNTCKIHIG